MSEEIIYILASFGVISIIIFVIYCFKGWRDEKRESYMRRRGYLINEIANRVNDDIYNLILHDDEFIKKVKDTYK